jgi:hypothetical protein
MTIQGGEKLGSEEDFVWIKPHHSRDKQTVATTVCPNLINRWRGSRPDGIGSHPAVVSRRRATRDVARHRKSRQGEQRDPKNQSFHGEFTNGCTATDTTANPLPISHP